MRNKEKGKLFRWLLPPLCERRGGIPPSSGSKIRERKTGPYLLPYLLIPPFRGLVPTSRPVEENSSQCAYQLLIDFQISYLDRIRANEPPPYCLFAHRRWALTRPVLIAIYWCSRHRKYCRLIQAMRPTWKGL